MLPISPEVGSSEAVSASGRALLERASDDAVKLQATYRGPEAPHLAHEPPLLAAR
jgi:hypothetical protein